MTTRQAYINQMKTGSEMPVEQHPQEEPVQQTAPETPKKKKAAKTGLTKRVRRAFQEVLGGDYLSKQTVAGNIGYILFLGLLAMIYISNTYYTEKMFKNIDKTRNELKELRYQFITTRSALMFQGRQSEISTKTTGMGLKESRIPPYKILYSGESLNQSTD